MSFQINRSSKEPMSEINVTPFVDVMLVLLIIFMVTAPLLTVGVQVDLPESAADSLPDDQEPLTISINSKGEIYIQEHQVTYQKMIPKLLAIAKNKDATFSPRFYEDDKLLLQTEYRQTNSKTYHHADFSLFAEKNKNSKHN